MGKKLDDVLNGGMAHFDNHNAGRHEARPNEIATNPINPRTELGDLSDLTESMPSVGQITPVTVVTSDAWLAVCPEHAEHIGTASYVLVAGARRLAAVAQLGMRTVDMVVKNGLAKDRVTLVEASLVENIARTDLTPMQVARTVEQIVQARGSQRKAAKRIGKTQAWVSQRVALLNLSPQMQAAVDAGEVKIKEALELAKVDPERQEQALSELRLPAPEPTGDNPVITSDATGPAGSGDNPVIAPGGRQPDGSMVEGDNPVITSGGQTTDPATVVDATVVTETSPATETLVSNGGDAVPVSNGNTSGVPKRPQPYRAKADRAASDDLVPAFAALVSRIPPAELPQCMVDLMRRTLAEQEVEAISQLLPNSV